MKLTRLMDTPNNQIDITYPLLSHSNNLVDLGQELKTKFFRGN